MRPDRLARGQQMLKWIFGHAVQALPSEEGMVRLRVNDEYEFSEPRVDFPSERLTAEIALCIDASGEFGRDAFDIGDFDPDWVMAALRIADDADDLKGAHKALSDANRHARVSHRTPPDVYIFMGERMP